MYLLCAVYSNNDFGFTSNQVLLQRKDYCEFLIEIIFISNKEIKNWFKQLNNFFHTTKFPLKLRQQSTLPKSRHLVPTCWRSYYLGFLLYSFDLCNHPRFHQIIWIHTCVCNESKCLIYHYYFIGRNRLNKSNYLPKFIINSKFWTNYLKYKAPDINWNKSVMLLLENQYQNIKHSDFR